MLACFSTQSRELKHVPRLALFGDAEDVQPLCDEICEWMWPKGMARRPVLSSSGEEELEEVVVEVVED